MTATNMTMTATDVTTTTRREDIEYVRTFLFSMKIDSPLARLHIITKVVCILILSLMVVQQMDMTHPDPVGVIVMAIFSLAVLIIGGALTWLLRSYLVVVFPMLGTLLFTWLLFNPDPGTHTFVSFPIYDGTVTLALSVSLLVLIVVPAIYFRITHKVFWGLVLGIALAIGLNRLGLNPRLGLAEVPIFHAMSFVISDKNLIVAVTKVFGYATMVLVSLTLVMTTRDAEVIGVMRQAKIPYAASFFTSIMLRSLSMAVFDYGTIRQAQVARGVDIQQKSIFGKVVDMARISVPLIVTMIRRSTEVGDAVLARGMTRLSSKPSLFKETRPVRAADIVIMILFVLLAVAVLGFQLNLTDILNISSLM
jgi:energy-coupling factor transporter transmembrane protein EcfT